MDATTGTTTLGRLRAALAKYRERKHYGKYPDKLRAEAIVYSRERRHQGASVRQIATELGVREATADGWVQEESSGHASEKRRDSLALADISLVPVTLKAEPAACERWGRLEVEFADGTRLIASGIGTQALADAIQALRGAR